MKEPSRASRERIGPRYQPTRLFRIIAMPPTMDVTVSPLADGDFETWHPLWKSYQAFYEVQIPEHVSCATWRRFLDPGEPVFGALAWHAGSALGLVHFIRHRSCWTTEDYCYLQDLFVAPEARGHGVGQALIRHAYARAAEFRCARVYWLTHETNAPAMQLYNRVAERSGLVQYRHDLRRP